MMADTPTNTGQQASATTDPTVIPQWKKELIQRRKNLAKTIGAVATQVHDSASTVAAAISAASSPVLAHPRTPTGAFPVGSPFYAGVATKDTVRPTEQQHLPLNHSLVPSKVLECLENPFPCPSSQQPEDGATSPTATGFIAATVGVHSPNEHTGGGLVVGSHGSVAANGVQSNSNAGAEHNGGSSSSVAAAATTASRPVSAEQQQSPQPIGSSSSSKPPFLVSGSAALSNGQQQQQQQQQQGLLRDGVAARKMVAATATEEIIVYEKSVISEVDGEELGGGGGSVGQFGLGDEELKYGPGIVSRLRCRYLSLALRQSVTKQRPSLNSMRRATSLNNLLDEESEDLSEREQSIGSEGCGGPGGAHGGQQQQQQKKYHTQSYHHTQHQQQHLYANGNNHHNHLIHNQPPHHPLGPTVVLQPAAAAAAAGGYQKKQPWHYNQPASEEQQAAATAVVVSKAAAPFLRGVQNSYTRASRQVEKKNDYNRYTKHHRGGSGGADSVLLKRARSVEALVRYDHKAWERDVTGTTRTSTAATAAAVAAAATPATTTPIVPSSVVETDSNVIILDEIAPTTTTVAATPNGGSIPAEHHHHHHGSNGISSSAAAPIIGTSPTTTTMMMNGGGGGGRMAVDLLVSSDCVTIEEKIINGREKGDPKPKRLTSFIDADERPPPDVVKQTMKIFEANANRRGLAASQRIPVAAPAATVTAPAPGEVATKVACYRSIIIATPAPVPAVTEKPPITHPKPPLSPKKPNIKPRTVSPKHQQAPAPPIVVVSPQAVTAKPPPTPKSLEAVNNLKNAANGAGTALRNGGPAPAPVNQPHPAGTDPPSPLAVTPPSPPARSKHVSQQQPPPPPLSIINNITPVSNGGAAGVGAKSTVATQDGGGFISHEAVATREPEPPRKPNSGVVVVAAAASLLKNGSGGDHHHNDHENGGQNQHTHVVSSSTAPPSTPLVRPLSSSPSPPTSSSGGICESPSLQQLTGQLASLHLATSTPTGAPSIGTERNSNGTSPTTAAVGDRRNLEYVTSEEDDDDDSGDGDGEGRRTEYTVNPSESSEEDIAVPGGGAGSKDVRDGAGYRSQVPLSNSENDADDDEDDEDEEEEGICGQDRSVRKVSRTAMENIARAGTTTQFRFNGATKSYLPGAGGGTGAGGSSTVSGKAPAPPIPIARESLLNAKPGAAVPANEVTGVSTGSGGARGGGASSNASKSDVAVGGGGSIGVDAATGGSSGGGVVRAPEAPLTRREIEKNQINRERSGEPGAATNNNNSNNGGVHNNSNSGNGKMKMMTGGVGASVEKSKAATTEPPRLGGAGSGSGSAVTDNSTSSFVAKWGTLNSPAAPAAAQSPQTVAAVAPAATTTPAIRKKPKPPPSQQQEASNTMVFNFSDRKDVPDYIENDGVIIRPRPRELPKPGESGFVVLGDLTLETSTDPDDAWAMGPPSPCTGEFANAYIVINGKSSMRNKTSRSNKFKIQFDDSLTSTYEYPSETSLLETNGFDDADSGSGPDNFGGAATDSGLLSHTNKLLSSVPLGSAPFASYTPVKAAIDTTFELGVTRTPSPSSASTASSTGSSNGSTSSSRSGSSSNNSSHQQHSATSHSDSHYLQHSLSGATIPYPAAVAATAAAAINGNGYGPGPQLLDRPSNNNGGNSLHSNGHHGDAVTSATARLLNGDATTLCGTGEPESIQYLKPASDEQTVNWSQGTRVTDLLF